MRSNTIFAVGIAAASAALAAPLNARGASNGPLVPTTTETTGPLIPTTTASENGPLIPTTTASENGPLIPTTTASQSTHSTETTGPLIPTTTETTGPLIPTTGTESSHTSESTKTESTSMTTETTGPLIPTTTGTESTRSTESSKTSESTSMTTETTGPLIPTTTASGSATETSKTSETSSCSESTKTSEGTATTETAYTTETTGPWEPTTVTQDTVITETSGPSYILTTVTEDYTTFVTHVIPESAQTDVVPVTVETTATAPAACTATGQPWHPSGVSAFFPSSIYHYDVSTGAITCGVEDGLIEKFDWNQGQDITTLVTFTYPEEARGKKCQFQFYLSETAVLEGSKKIDVFTSLNPAPGCTGSWPPGNQRNVNIGRLSAQIGSFATWDATYGAYLTEPTDCKAPGTVEGLELVGVYDNDHVSWYPDGSGARIAYM